MADTSEDCEVTNSSDVDIVVMDAVNASDNYTSLETKNVRSTSKNTSVVYERKLTTQLTSDKKNLLPSGTTNTIKLQGFYYDENQHQVYRTIYNLIFASPNSLFPIKNLFEIQDPISLSYAAIIATTTDKEQMELAFQFYQLIQAFPTSMITQNFYDTLIQAANLTTIEDIDSAIAAYFATVLGYETLDLLSISAVWTYIEMYACAWASNQEAINYYLYTTLTQQESEDAGPVKKVAPHFVGTLVFSKASPPPDKASLTDYNSAYSISFIDAHPEPDISDTTVLFYYRGQLLSDLPENNPTPSIRIQGSFAPQNQWTNVQSDHQLIPVFYGVVNGQAVLGLNTEQNDPTTAWYGLWNRVTFKGWVALSHQYMSLMFAGMVLVRAAMFQYSQLQSLVSQNQDRSAGKIQLNQLQADTQKLLSRIPEGSSQLDNILPYLRQILAYQFTVQESEVQTDIFIAQAQQLKGLGMDAGKENAATSEGETTPVDTTLLKSTADLLLATTLNLVCALKAYIEAGKTTVCLDVTTARNNFYQAIKDKNPDRQSIAEDYREALEACAESMKPSITQLKTAVTDTRSKIGTINTNLAQLNADFANILSSDTQQVIQDTNEEIQVSLAYEQELQANEENTLNGIIDVSVVPGMVNFFT